MYEGLGLSRDRRDESQFENKYVEKLRAQMSDTVAALSVIRS